MAEIKRSGFDPFITQDYIKPNLNKFNIGQVGVDILRQQQQDSAVENAPYLSQTKLNIQDAIQNSMFGSAGSDMSQIDVGAFKDIPKAPSIINQAKEKEEEVETKKNLIDLSAIDQAKLIAEGAYAGQTGSEPDWGVASLLYFSKMAEEASKPGATALGAAGSAATAPAAYLMQKEKQKADQKNKQASLIASLVPSLQAAKLKAKPKELPYVDTQGNVTYYNATQFANLAPNVKNTLIPYKDKNAESTKVYENTSEVDIVLGDKTIKPKGKMRLSEKDLAILSPEVSGNLIAFKKEASVGERERAKLIKFGFDYKNLNAQQKTEYGILYQEAVEGKPTTEFIDGKEVTRKMGGIDLRILKNLPVPEGYDVNKVLKSKTRDFKPNQIKSTAFGIRMFTTDGVINELLDDGYRPNLQDMVKNHKSVVAGTGTTLQSPQARSYYAATSNFISALLREESGAAIGEGEYQRRVRELFPQIGDDANTIQLKKQLREREIQTFVKAGGDAFTVFHPDAKEFLTTKVGDKTYDKLNSKGFYKYIQEQTALTDGIIYKTKIQDKTAEELKAMIGSSDASSLLADYQLDVIAELIELKLGENDPNE